MKKCHFYAYWAAFVAALGGFLQSYTTCAVAGAILCIGNEFDLSIAQEGLLAGIVMLGAFMTTLLAGPLADALGRRAALFLAALLYIASSVPILFVGNFALLIALRFITGIAVGITALAVPLYLAEIAPPSKRGGFVASFQLAVTMGTLAAYVVSMLLVGIGHWRGMLAITALPAMFQLVALLFIPESPKWLLGVGKKEESQRVLQHLHTEGGGKGPEGHLEKPTWRAVWAPKLRKGLWLGFALVMLQQWSGINAIVYFAPKIFQGAGFVSPQSAMRATLWMGVACSVATFIALCFVDRFGRRKTLLFSQVGVFLSLALFTFYQHGMLAFSFLIAFIFTYSLGLGPIPWILISEIYPLKTRARAIALMSFLCCLATFLVVFSFPLFLSYLGIFGTFALYASISLAAIWLFWNYVPETKGKSLEEIERTFY